VSVATDSKDRGTLWRVDGHPLQLFRSTKLAKTGPEKSKRSQTPTLRADCAPHFANGRAEKSGLGVLAVNFPGRPIPVIGKTAATLEMLD
jgi:hypothetical protein